MKDDRLMRAARILEQALQRNVPGNESAWAAGVHRALTAVEQAIRHEPDLSETVDDIIANVPGPTQAPTQARREQELSAERGALLERVHELDNRVRAAGEAFAAPAAAGVPPRSIPDFGALGQAGEELPAALVQLHEAESKLLLETVTTDVGVGD